MSDKPTKTTSASAVSTPKRKLTRNEIEAELDARSSAISRRVTAIEEEVSSTPASIQDYLLNNPWIGLGGALLAGVAVGLLVGGRQRKKRARRYQRSHRALVDTYLATVGEEVRRAIAKGRDAEAAVQEALRDRTPLVVHHAADENKRSSIREGADLIGKTMFAWTVRSLADQFARPYLPNGGAGTEKHRSTEVISAVSESQAEAYPS